MSGSKPQDPDANAGGDASAPVAAPGWDAIDRAVGRHFAAQTPHQFSSRTAYDLDSPSPLPAITVWETRAPAGWLYVSYGLSELFDKTSQNPGVSGFGYEFSLRLPREPGHAHPPVWPLRLLQALGHHVLSTGAGFDSGHAIDLGASMVQPGSDGPQGCALTGLICLPDPLLGKIHTPHGSLLFLRLFGVAADELKLLDELELGDLVACLAELEPLAITDPTRASFTEDPERAKILRRYRVGISL